MAQVATVLPEFTIESVDTTVTALATPEITTLANGNYVVVWNVTSGGDQGLLARIYAADGTLVRDDFSLESTTAGAQGNPAVTALPGGGFIVVWRSDDDLENTDGNIRARVFDASGNGVADDQVINSTLDATQALPIVTALADGRILVAWQSGDAGDASLGIRAVFLDAAGVPVGSDVLVNTVTEGAQRSPQVAALSGGGYVIAWSTVGGIAFTQQDSAGGVVSIPIR